MVKVARPCAFSASTPPTLPPSMVNWTVPPGMPVPLTGLTVAVKVTLWPRFAAGFRLLVITVLVARRTGPTVWVNVVLVLPR